MVSCPYELSPTYENTLMIDDNPSKNILNPTSNFLVCLTWTVGKVKYFQDLLVSGVPAPNFVRNNSIGERYVDSRDYMYRELFNHTKFNKLI